MPEEATAPAAEPVEKAPAQEVHVTPATQTVQHAHFGLKLILLVLALAAVGVVLYLAATL